MNLIQLWSSTPTDVHVPWEVKKLKMQMTLTQIAYQTSLADLWSDHYTVFVCYRSGHAPDSCSLFVSLHIRRDKIWFSLSLFFFFHVLFFFFMFFCVLSPFYSTFLLILLPNGVIGSLTDVHVVVGIWFRNSEFKTHIAWPYALTCKLSVLSCT